MDIRNLTNSLGFMVKTIWREHGSDILSAAAAVGVGATAVLAVKNDRKARFHRTCDIEEKVRNGEVKTIGDYTKMDCFKATWKDYIPSVTCGVFTVGLIVGSDILNHKRQASLISAYALLQEGYSRYQNKVIDLYGMDTHDKVMNAIYAEEVEEDHAMWTENFCSRDTTEFGDDGSEQKHTFIEAYTGRKFIATLSRVHQAEYHLNRNFMFAGEACLNDFYEFLGLPKTDYGEAVGWSAYNGDLYWIDFNHKKEVLDDGFEYYVIDFVFSPCEGYFEEPEFDTGIGEPSTVGKEFDVR